MLATAYMQCIKQFVAELLFVGCATCLFTIYLYITMRLLNTISRL